jgi:hypothetical protein
LTDNDPGGEGGIDWKLVRDLSGLSAPSIALGIGVGNAAGGGWGAAAGIGFFLVVLGSARVYRRRPIVKRTTETTRLKKEERVIEEREVIEETQEIEGS